MAVKKDEKSEQFKSIDSKQNFLEESIKHFASNLIGKDNQIKIKSRNLNIMGTGQTESSIGSQGMVSEKYLMK